MRGQDGGGDGCVSAGGTERRQDAGKRETAKARQREEKRGKRIRHFTGVKTNSVEFKLDFCQHSVNPLDLVNNI